MWICTSVGFFSVVAKASDPSVVKIRSRCREDLEELVAALRPEVVADHKVVIVDTPCRDYPHRIFMPKRVFAEVMWALTVEIDYTNFKGHIGASKRQGYKRAGVYSEVWSTLHKIQTGPSRYS